MEYADQEDFKNLVHRAEQAVASVKDPELRRVAFEKILDRLLGAGEDHVLKKGKQKKQSASTNTSTAKTTGRRSSGPTGFVREMTQDGFFKKPKTIAQVKAELENRGHHIPLTSLSGPLQSLCKDRTLRRQRTTDGGKKQTFSYSNW